MAKRPKTTAAAAAPADEPDGFRAPNVARIVGITYRQLDHWATKGIVKPSLRTATGSGSRRLYTYRDLLELKVVQTLREQGFGLGKITDIFDYVRDRFPDDVAVSHIAISGSQVVVVSDDEVVDVLRRKGQGVLNLVSLGPLSEQLDESIAEAASDESDDTDGTQHKRGAG
ncbi:MAG TPA: MerR family transcriptional regulator [Acidimicrobiaceae bacterium]|nr:MerR family transcriptional regulator [Acidimicrobiaceae bacterium]HCB37097.1 MerR family transcriptional regulator [Acidimicrobiaceae bacterium]